ncbi:MAG: cytochrome d ubiquinol oxidase subunit II, partial [Burkholderiales bacterium]|nr:cytochrome d ubiquinol oxidase subunit II [Burkholderiales bacterium]
LVIGYSLLGSARLIKKTTGNLQTQLFGISSKLQWFLLVAILFVGFYSPETSSPDYISGFKLDYSPFMVLFTIVIILLMGLHALAIKKRIEQLPFMTLIGVFLMAYIAFVISNLPYLVPHQITFMQAKADDGALMIMLYGVAVLLPLLLFYTAYAYHIFGGKVQDHEKISY